MKHIQITGKLLLTIFLFTSITAISQQKMQQFYQLKTYSFTTDDQVNRTDEFLENAYLPALKRQNIENIGVFKPKSYIAGDTLQKTMILIPFSSLEDFESMEGKLLQDETYQRDGAAYINAAYDDQPYVRINSIVMKAFEDMPVLRPSTLTTDRKDRVYELRSYQSPTVAYHKNKVEMFNEGGEVGLFEDLGFNAVFYASVISGPDMPNLMYMTTFKNQVNRDAHWEAFGNSPEWKKLSALPKYQNNVSHIDITFLYPTEYSDY
ncbi:MAG: NIPSNAP family protein [Leeuwenhoekiella sp.]